MSDTVTKERLIFTDLTANNNKFWHAELDGSTMTVTFGRVGDAGQHKVYNFTSPEAAQKRFDSDVRGKLRKGYTRQQTIAEGKQDVAFVAKFQIQHNNDKETTALIDFLVKRNIHKIEGTTSIRMEAGRLTTPLGPVTADGLAEAEVLLSLMAAKDANFADYANQYLRIVPRNIGRRRIDPETLFGTRDKLLAEQATVDSLRAVVKDLDQQVTADGPPVFQTKLEIVDPSIDTFRRIRKIYEAGLNRRHTSYGMQLHRVWEMYIESSVTNFDGSVGNVRELWHGTKDANLLSILKNGFVIPRSGTSIAITGRMFGDGIYFSDQSTKSLNYATGYWGNGASQRAFMLLNDVAMGREYVPTGRGMRTLPKGYDSCFAKANTSGVLNNEMIVYKTTQVKPKYLCEFR